MSSENKKHIVSLSGGKDSTALLLMMLERSMKVDEVIFADTGMEFPEMYKHIEKVKKATGIEITVLRHKESFEHLLGERVKKNGQVGYGWPDFRNRWCTTLMKRDLIKKYINAIGDVVEYHGIAADEAHRAKRNPGRNILYPLIKWNITEAQALQYCYDKGFDWGGLYGCFDRVSCWCCPLSRIGELRTLYSEYPELWSELQRIDKKSRRKFRPNATVEQLTERFKKEGNNE